MGYGSGVLVLIGVSSYRASTPPAAPEQRLQAGERVAGGGRRGVGGARGADAGGFDGGRGVLGVQCADAGVVELARVLVVVAVHAQELPVAAVGRIVGVVVVTVVDCQFLQIGAGELARAAPADPRVHLQRALAVALLA